MSSSWFVSVWGNSHFRQHDVSKKGFAEIIQPESCLDIEEKRAYLVRYSASAIAPLLCEKLLTKCR
ncbi:hypothetical protein FNW02_25220 [Komarekiella sp. 'clone 1']|uniref:Uncharacterized protein n=1 Tax=Komarekiella delphini-convector SJRDD-AB1 TaxID=2593771 RepID=A0AA40VTB4_9NOST|nr:hypothetical protein [Komarekiella delphini-convector]MBD6619034.1 hypothetical protein [Komarekiella delphini-convector SJRDD-AB1]